MLDAHVYNSVDQAVIKCEVCVPTATIILHVQNNPYLIVVGSSSKHDFPVLPGGKIDQADLITTNLEEAAFRCAIRELEEEVGFRGTLYFIDALNRFGADTRIIEAQDLKSTLVYDAVRSLPDTERIKAHYGVPDYIFSAAVNPKELASSEELSSLSLIDLRNLSGIELSAGHKELLQKYYSLGIRI